MKLCKPFYSKHQWARYDVLVEQFFTGGYYAFQRCQKCRKIKFASCDKYTPEEPGWKERQAEVDRIMAKDYRSKTDSQPGSKEK